MKTCNIQKNQHNTANMAYYNRVWSVASVFNEYGMFRYKKTFNREYVWRTNFDEKQAIDEQRINVESVADCIRRLGYTVRCETTEDSRRYIIMSISKQKFYYGGTTNVNCVSHYQQLSGKRTIYEKAIEIDEALYKIWCEQGLCRSRCYNLRDISGEIAQKKIKSLIEDGSLWHKNIHTYDIYEQGVSTIGNTLPSDIVQALQDFTSESP